MLELGVNTHIIFYLLSRDGSYPAESKEGKKMDTQEHVTSQGGEEGPAERREKHADSFAGTVPLALLLCRCDILPWGSHLCPQAFRSLHLAVPVALDCLEVQLDSD